MEEYKLVRKNMWAKIKPGDKMRYSKDNKIHYGGFVRKNNFPVSILVINPINKFSWNIYLNDTSLKLWSSSLETQKKLRLDKDKIYQLYKEGKLVKLK
jgi:hypothetical protein